LLNWPRWKKALEKIKLLVVFDSFRSDLTALANIAFPIRSFHEFEGTVLSALGEFKTSKGLIPGTVGQSLPRLLLKLESELGKSEQAFELLGKSNQTLPELVSEVRKIHRMRTTFNSRSGDAPSAKTVIASSSPNPVPPNVEGTGVSQKGSRSGQNAEVSKSDSFSLLVGNNLYHSGSMTLRGAHLAQFLDRAMLINPVDAEKMKVEDGANLQVSIGNKKFSVPAKLCEDIMQGCCFLPVNGFSPEERPWFEGISKSLAATVKPGGAA